MSTVASHLQHFEASLPRMRALAYRMLGSYAEAEDVVQDAWLRWHGIDAGDIDKPQAFLSRTVTRLCLDRLRAAKSRREQYIGPWLPEPLAEGHEAALSGPEAASELAGDASVALLLALERLSPAERAAFLLHDVFDLDYREVAQALERSQEACRQLASRARRQVRAAGPRYRPDPEHAARLLQAFGDAVQRGDIAALTALLVEDARYVSDGGGQVAAPLRPVSGAARIAKALVGFSHKHHARHGIQPNPARINGLPGIIFTDRTGGVVQTLTLELQVDGRIRAIYVVRNPDKLRHFPTRGKALIRGVRCDARNAESWVVSV